MSEIALKLIAENKKTRSPFLDLGNCGLTEVPEEIGELVWLEELSFANLYCFFKENEKGKKRFEDSESKNNIARLLPAKLSGKDVNFNPFSRLVKLKELHLNDLCLLNSWLDRMDFNDLSPLSNLVNLQKLFIAGSQVDDLSPLSNLTNLQFLDIGDTQITDLSPLVGLNNLQSLFISKTPAIDLHPLSELKKLQRLYASKTPVLNLSPLSGLTNLEYLDVADTQVNDLSPLFNLIKNNLPVHWERDTDAKKSIYVENCPLTNPPIEIVKQGNTAILNYFHETAIQHTDRQYEAKMLIIGEGGAGKTSLLRRLFQTEKLLPNENETTKGIDIYRHEFKLANGHNFRLNVWDFGGQEIYHATHQFFLTKRSLYVLLDDTRKDDKTVHDNNFKYWLEVADLLGDHSPVIIFQNEKGGRSKAIDETGIKAKFNNVKDVYRGNLERNDSVDNLRKAIEFFAQNLPHIGEKLPTKWLVIRAELELLAINKPFISQQEYFDIYQKHLVFDREKALCLSSYLHDLGVFLHFQDDPLLARTVILQNAWVTDAVFKLLNDEVVKVKLGRFDNADCQRIWRDSEYAYMHPELLAAMQKFELCYKLPDTQGEYWLIPQLLPPSKPAALSDWRQIDGLTLSYRYKFLPKGIVTRLMVRMHRFAIHPELSWANGVLFERGDTQVLAEVSDKGGEILLRARGAERKELLSVIAADLDALNEHFHGLKDLVAKWVPCLCSRCLSLSDPEFFEQQRLLKRKIDGRLKVECPASYENVDVLQLLDGIRVDQLPGWAKDDVVSTSLPKKANNELTIKIFLASSSELKEDRDAFELYFRQQNDRLRKQGIYLEILRWENFLDAMSETRLQDEYNKEVKACDIL